VNEAKDVSCCKYAAYFAFFIDCYLCYDNNDHNDISRCNSRNSSIPRHEPSFSLTICEIVCSILASSSMVKITVGFVANIDDTLMSGRPERGGDDDDGADDDDDD